MSLDLTPGNFYDSQGSFESFCWHGSAKSTIQCPLRVNSQKTDGISADRIATLKLRLELRDDVNKKRSQSVGKGMSKGRLAKLATIQDVRQPGDPIF